jgi:hypothetical protein
MEGTLISIEKLERSSGIVRAEIYQVSPDHFRAQYLNIENEEVWLPSEHVGTSFAQASSQIGARLRGWVEARLVVVPQ